MRGYEGIKYKETANLDRRDIAKLMRQDIKALGLSKGFKVSVKIERYSGGGSVNVVVTAVPEGFIRLAPPRWEFQPYSARLNPEAADLIVKLQNVWMSYNYDHSEIETDHFNYRFAGRVEYDRDLLDNSPRQED